MSPREDKFGDKGIPYMTLDRGICNRCKHVRENGMACEAFREIPAVILTGQHDHHHPFEGDHGIQFEARDASEERE